MLDFPGDSAVKNSPVNAGVVASISEMGRSPAEGDGNPLQYSSPGKSHGQRSLVGYSLWGLKESGMTERVNNNKIPLGRAPPSRPHHLPETPPPNTIIFEG